MPQLLEIIRLGHPTLRKKAAPILDISKHESFYSSFIEDLFYTQKQQQGVGIAAPQVNISKRLVIVASYPNQRYPNAPLMEPTVMINPEITWYSKEMEKGWEGCLSVPGFRGFVPRHKVIKLNYVSMDGKSYVDTFSDFPARVIQHELDHLDGIIFIDRVETITDLIHEFEYELMVNSSQ